MTTYSGRNIWQTHKIRWPIAPLKMLARIGTGHTPSRNHPEWWENCTIPWVTTEDLTSRADGGLRPLMDTRQKISELGLAHSAAVLHPTNTVMLSRTASVGHAVRIGRPMATTQAFVTWTCGPLLDPQYLLLVLNAMRPEFERIAYGSTHLTIYMPDLEQLRVPLPPTPVQRAIADFLDAETARIDALIEKKQRMVKLAKDRERSVVAILLSSVASQSRAIRLGQVLERIVDYRGATPEKTEEGVPLLTATNVTNGEIDLELSRQYVSERTYLEWMTRGFPEPRDILLTTEAPLGEVALISDRHVALAQRLMLLRVRQDLVSPEYLRAYLRSPVGQAELLSRASGSTVMGVRTDRLREVLVQVPSQTDQAQIVAEMRIVSSWANAVGAVLTEQIELLRERRQSLITSAVSGELEVPAVAA